MEIKLLFVDEVISPDEKRIVTGIPASSCLTRFNGKEFKMLEIQIDKRVPKKYVPMIVLHELVEQITHNHEATNELEEEIFGLEMFQKSRVWAINFCGKHQKEKECKP